MSKQHDEAGGDVNDSAAAGRDRGAAKSAPGTDPDIPKPFDPRHGPSPQRRRDRPRPAGSTPVVEAVADSDETNEFIEREMLASMAPPDEGTEEGLPEDELSGAAPPPRVRAPRKRTPDDAVAEADTPAVAEPVAAPTRAAEPSDPAELSEPEPAELSEPEPEAEAAELSDPAVLPEPEPAELSEPEPAPDSEAAELPEPAAPSESAPSESAPSESAPSESAPSESAEQPVPSPLVDPGSDASPEVTQPTRSEDQSAAIERARIEAAARIEASMTAAAEATPAEPLAEQPPLPAGPPRRVLQRFITPLDGHRGDSRALYAHGLMFDVNRRSCVIPEHQSVSFGTYFNAFPAAYWRRWTDIETVRLSLRIRGNGKVTLFRSTSKGMSWPEQNLVFEGDGLHEVAIDLPLEPFIDGGWYWFDVLAFGGNDVVIEDGDWSAETPRTRRGRVSVGITTYNRPDYCVDQIRALGAHDDLLEVLDAVYVVDQGSHRVQDYPGFDEAAVGLGDKLRVIEQGNLGGSGGFARAMHETITADESDYLLLLDDDVICEPEGIIRAAAFADLARQPILVGGHMFSIFVRSVLHAWGESIAKYRWMWGPAPHTHHGHDFGAVPLAREPWLHRRVDVDYNGWWMCLIPTAAIKKIGLALPMFIKWDDADFGLRAGEQGFPTVSLPGVAVWHVPWHEKDDTIDWQAYFHERNRLLSAMLHSPYKHGGRLPRESFEVVMKHALAMQYSPAEMILQAIEDLLDGPHHLHRDIPTKIAELRELRTHYDDSRYEQQLQSYPSVQGKPPRRGHLPPAPKDKRTATLLALRTLPRQFIPVSAEARLHPQAALPHADQVWWRLAQFDSVLVSSADGSGAAWLRRDHRRFRSITRRSMVLHARLAREWDELALTYRAAVPEVSSLDAWSKTFARSEAESVPSAYVARKRAEQRDGLD